MNKQTGKTIKIIISLIILFLFVFAVRENYLSFDNNQKVIPIQHKINTNNLTMLENTNISSSSTLSFMLKKNAEEFLLVIYSNTTSGNIKLINPNGDIEISQPTTGESNLSETRIHSNPPSLVFVSGTWNLKYNITGNAHIMLYVMC